MYAIYLNNDRVARTDRFSILPSGAVECRTQTGAILKVIAPGSWDHVVWQKEEQ